ncbi:hypothetical protein H9Q69_005661 [Fusarium xylarioides]|nr:hypothetical protein H9Q69_005661 [Fusarium xylarioides]
MLPFLVGQAVIEPPCSAAFLDTANSAEELTIILSQVLDTLCSTDGFSIKLDGMLHWNIRIIVGRRAEDTAILKIEPTVTEVEADNVITEWDSSLYMTR